MVLVPHSRTDRHLAIFPSTVGPPGRRRVRGASPWVAHTGPVTNAGDNPLIRSARTHDAVGRTWHVISIFHSLSRSQYRVSSRSQDRSGRGDGGHSLSRSRCRDGSRSRDRSGRGRADHSLSRSQYRGGIRSHDRSGGASGVGRGARGECVHTQRERATECVQRGRESDGMRGHTRTHRATPSHGQPVRTEPGRKGSRPHRGAADLGRAAQSERPAGLGELHPRGNPRSPSPCPSGRTAVPLSRREARTTSFPLPLAVAWCTLAPRGILCGRTAPSGRGGSVEVERADVHACGRREACAHTVGCRAFNALIALAGPCARGGSR